MIWIAAQARAGSSDGGEPPRREGPNPPESGSHDPGPKKKPSVKMTKANRAGDKKPGDKKKPGEKKARPKVAAEKNKSKK